MSMAGGEYDRDALDEALLVFLIKREREGKAAPQRLVTRAVVSQMTGRTVSKGELKLAVERTGVITDVVRDPKQNIVRSVYRLPASLSQITRIRELLARDA
jgi:hypothetical protein